MGYELFVDNEESEACAARDTESEHRNSTFGASGDELIQMTR